MLWRVTGVIAFVASAVVIPGVPGGGDRAERGMAGTEGTGGAACVRFLAVGDVNLGRRAGQILLQGDTLYPWRNVQQVFAQYDVVFANLESNLSEQHGRTVSRSSNMVFTGPPVGALSAKRAGITVVATANNHALDFGLSALLETRTYLRNAGILFAGTGEHRDEAFAPAELDVHGIHIALFACTSLMNDARDGTWKQHVADTDTATLYPLIRKERSRADIVVVSVHGGVEYAQDASEAILSFARGAVDAGADLVLGHHPHVPYRARYYRGAVIAPSLGNFVFAQSFSYWTQRGVALAVEFARDSTGVHRVSARCLPVRAGFQPFFLPPGEEYTTVSDRVDFVETMEHHDQ